MYDPELYSSLEQKLEIDSRNSLVVSYVVKAKLRKERENSHRRPTGLQISPQWICDLHSYAMRDLYKCAGQFRPHFVRITGSSHTPPAPENVEGLVAQMCDNVLLHPEWEPPETAAYLLWRLNWIHPFMGGNGRTSRALAKYALHATLEGDLPGQAETFTYVTQNRARYIAALVDADTAWRETSIADVSQMQAIIDDAIVMQLKEYLKQ